MILNNIFEVYQDMVDKNGYFAALFEFLHWWLGGWWVVWMYESNATFSFLIVFIF